MSDTFFKTATAVALYALIMLSMSQCADGKFAKEDAERQDAAIQRVHDDVRAIRVDLAGRPQ